MITYITMGLLGWSNKRTGLEFYRWDEKIIPRHNSEWGDLLVRQEFFPGGEGDPVLVITFPRATTAGELSRAATAIQHALANLP